MRSTAAVLVLTFGAIGGARERRVETRPPPTPETAPGARPEAAAPSPPAPPPLKPSARQRTRDTRPWNEYVPTSLAEATDRFRQPMPEAEIVYETAVPKYLVKARYAGERRKLPAARGEFLSRWERVTGHRFPVTAMFHDEVLIEESGKAYWLPVQGVLLPSLDAELSKGDEVEWFVIFVGRERGDLIFLINEFDRLE